MVLIIEDTLLDTHIHHIDIHTYIQSVPKNQFLEYYGPGELNYSRQTKINCMKN